MVVKPIRWIERTVMSNDKNPLGNVMGAAGGFLQNLKDKAEDAVEVVKDKAEDAVAAAKEGTDGLVDKAEAMIGEDNIKKATDFLNTDVGAIAGDLSEKAMGAVSGLKDQATGLVDQAKDALDQSKSE